MAIHLLRDYVIQTTDTVNVPNYSTILKKGYVAAHLTAIFLRRVCGFSAIGNTNWNINTVGTYLIDTADTTPNGTPTFGVGKKASINLGSNLEYNVAIPSSTRIVSGVDIGRMLVLKSTANPRFNSGIFLIIGYDTATNSYLIDYRSLGTFPPAETDALDWYLYERDSVTPTPGTNSGAVGYQGGGASTTPRVILQSPHALGWQIRICQETGTDYSARIVPQFSTAVGYGGNSAGDFTMYGQHLHIPLWYGTNGSLARRYSGTPGASFDALNPVSQLRVSIIADDGGQSVSIIGRTAFSSSKSFMISLGVPENEPSPLPNNILSRLYSFGCGGEMNSSGYNNSDITWSTNQSSTYQSNNYISAGMGATIGGAPATCTPSVWTYITGVSNQLGPMYNSQASDCPFISATELLPVDLVVGTRDNWFASAPFQYPFEPRVIGTLPFFKSGRTNFGAFSLTTDSNKTYLHLQNGVYMLWEGPQAVP